MCCKCYVIYNKPLIPDSLHDKHYIQLYAVLTIILCMYTWLHAHSIWDYSHSDTHEYISQCVLGIDSLTMALIDMYAHPFLSNKKSISYILSLK